MKKKITKKNVMAVLGAVVLVGECAMKVIELFDDKKGKN